jgi:hypothetical protein
MPREERKPVRFQVNTPNVIHETYDTEVVIVNLESGNYYSVLRASADIWNLIAHGATAEETIQALAQSYAGERGAIERGVNDLIAQLQSEGLIVPAQNPPAPANWELKQANVVFETPALQKFSDMQELLLLDPIHQVDESGWPARPSSPETP